MDLRTLVMSFGVVFLAELGDKTQLANLGLVAKTKEPSSVYLGSILAYLAVSFVTITLGGYLTKALPGQAVRIGSGALFIIVGVFLLWGKG